MSDKKQKNPQIEVRTFNWGPCVIKLKIQDNFKKALLNEIKKSAENYNDKLAGQIEKEIGYTEESREKLIPFLSPYLGVYDQMFQKYQGKMYDSKPEYALTALWCNFQRQYEFNPPHDHGGVYSFVIWMQIPTSYAEQRKLPVCAESNADNHISNFAFSYTNTLGKVSTFAYNMEKEAEGYMVMFPSQMLHQVFPFYENDGERISISGNINIEKKES